MIARTLDVLILKSHGYGTRIRRQQIQGSIGAPEGVGAKLIHELSIAGTERILDLGCGDGALTAQLAELAPQGSALGIDASHGRIKAARVHVADNLCSVRHQRSGLLK